MAKSYMMGDATLSEEERLLMDQSRHEQDEKMKDLHAQEQEKEKQKKVVTLEQLLKTTINPREDRVVVWPDPVEAVTPGGIIKPNEAIERERPLMGTVIAVGPGKKVEQNTTNYLLLQILQYGSDISTPDFEKVKGEISKIMEEPMKPGDRILYGRFAGTPVPDPETKTELLIMRPTDIFATL